MAETYTGHVRNGVVVFEGDMLPEGTVVRIEPVLGTIVSTTETPERELPSWDRATQGRLGRVWPVEDFSDWHPPHAG